MSIFTSIENDFEAIWGEIGGFFKADVEPILKDFFQQFAGAEGKLILTEGIVAASALATGVPFASVGAKLFTDLLEKSETLASKDAGAVLLAVQSAVQIGKVSAGTLTASDQATVATAPPPAA